MHTPRTLIDLGRGLAFPESPRWNGDRLWFTDINGKAIRSTGLTGDVRTEIDLPFLPNGLGFMPDGSIVFGDALNLVMKHWDGSTLRDLASLQGRAEWALSDAVTDAQGRTYVGDVGYNFWNPEVAATATAVINRIDPDGSVVKVADGLRFPNGLALSQDGKTLIIAETDGCRLTAYDVDGEGDLSNGRTHARLPEGVKPDGICLDAEGCVWVSNAAGSPAVLRVREGGEVTDTIELETPAYAVVLGGPERRHLFICTSPSHDPAEVAARPRGRILVVEVPIPGAGSP